MSDQLRKIIERKGLYFVVERFGTRIYTYATCKTEKKAQETLDFINTEYGNT